MTGARPLDLALLLLPAAIWASLVVVGASVMVDIGPITLACVTWIVGALSLLPAAASAFRGGIALRQEWPLISFCALSGVALFQALWFAGLLVANPANVAILTATLPVIVAAVAAVVLGERLNRLQLIGVGVTGAAAIWIGVSGDLRQLAAFKLGQGELLILLANLSMAGYTIALKRRPTQLSANSFMALVAALGALLLAPAAYLEGGLSGGWEPFARHWMAIAYIGIFTTAIAYVIWNRSVARNGANLTALFLYTQPVFALFFCWLFLDQPILPHHWLGMALVATGIYLVTPRPRRGVNFIDSPA